MPGGTPSELARSLIRGRRASCYILIARTLPAASPVHPIKQRGIFAMARANKFDGIDRQIFEAHRRYLEIMEEQRLSTISAETKEHYLRMLTSLTDKLALPSKPLSEIVGEIRSEAAPFLFQALQR
jgi:hypothetical protein